MVPISSRFAEYLANRAGLWQVKLNVNGVEYGNDTIVDFTIKTNMAGDKFELGGGICDELAVTLRTDDVIPANARIMPYLALDGSNGMTEWLPMGEFFVDSREQMKRVWTFSCLDRLVYADVPYVSGLSYPATMQDIWNEMMALLDFESDASVIIHPSYVLPVAPTGFTCRQVMSFIASANAACVGVSRIGKMAFRRFSAASPVVQSLYAGDYIRVKQLNPLKSYTRIVVEVDDETGFAAGSGDADHTLTVVNPLGSQSMANYLLTQLNGFSYVPAAIEARGFPQIESGDLLGFWKHAGTPPWVGAETQWDETEYTWEGGDISGGQTVALYVTHTFKGGLRTSLEARSESAQQSEFKVDGTLSGAIKRLNQAAVKLGKPYYGVTMTREDGLKIARSDQVSDLTLNSDVMDWRVNGQSSLHLDAIAGKLKFRGDIAMEGGTISWSSVNAPTPAQVGALPSNDPKLSQLSGVGAYLGSLAQGQVTGLPDRISNLSSIGDYIGALSQGQVTGLSTRLTNIAPTGVYTGTVGTDQLIAGSALIGSALIESLVVGNNVTMGPNAYISWGNVTNQPTAGQLGGLMANSPMLTYIGPTGIYSGQVTTDQLVAGNARISTALIENLVVGGNVSMGPSAYISWDNVTGKNLDYSVITGSKPPTNADNTYSAIGPGRLTQINAFGIYTGTLTAAQVNAVEINADAISAGTLTGRTVRTAASGTRVELVSNLADVNLYNGTSNVLRLQNNFDNTSTIWSPSGGAIFIGSSGHSIYPSGSWNFTSASVTGITARFG